MTLAVIVIIAVGSGEGNVNGFGLEFFIETPSDEIADSVDDIKRSWQFQLLYTVSQLAAGMQLLTGLNTSSCSDLPIAKTLLTACTMSVMQAMAASDPFWMI